MLKHFWSNEQEIYVDEFIEIVINEFKYLFKSLKFSDLEIIKQELVRKISLNGELVGFGIFNIWTK